MKRYASRLNQDRIKFAPAKDQAGIATGCLVAIIAVILVFVAIGVYVANHYQTWIAHGIAAGMHALIETSDQIGWEIVDEILAPISDPGEDGNQHLRTPAEVSDGDIRQVLAAVQETADDAEISREKIEVDISDEFKKSVEIALGREI